MSLTFHSVVLHLDVMLSRLAVIVFRFMSLFAEYHVTRVLGYLGCLHKRCFTQPSHSESGSSRPAKI